jgi:murein DD-endopeptidase MepM/ murein hydrolase activator NlpD
LGGTPRKVTSGMGDRRDAGRRRHKGVDFASDRGEPVYAIADGVVAVAGPQMKQGVTPIISAREARAIPREQLARGGLFIMIDHADHKRSAYMHLDTYYVRRGERVKRGQLIGTVGRSGLKGAHAHLHFELREHTSRTVRDRHLDPLNVLGSLVIAPHDTWRGRRLARGRSFVK